MGPEYLASWERDYGTLIMLTFRQCLSVSIGGGHLFQTTLKEGLKHSHHSYGETIALTIQIFFSKVMVLILNTL